MCTHESYYDNEDSEMPETETRYEQTSGSEITHMPDGLVIYQHETDRVHFLNPSSALVFELCNGRHMPAEMAVILSEAYQLRTPAVDEVNTCISNLVAQGLVAPCPSSASAL
jgi:Coenzyme PQQ synthesis protein D (PqqD)